MFEVWNRFWFSKLQFPQSPAREGIQSLTGREKKGEKKAKKNPKQKTYKKVIEQALSCFTEFLSYEALTIYNVCSLLPEGFWSLLQAFYARLRYNSAEFHVYKSWQQFTSDFTINSVCVWVWGVWGTYFPMLPSNGFFLQSRWGTVFISTVKMSHLKHCGLSHQARHWSPASLFECVILGVISWLLYAKKKTKTN